MLWQWAASCPYLGWYEVKKHLLEAVAHGLVPFTLGGFGFGLAYAVLLRRGRR